MTPPSYAERASRIVTRTAQEMRATPDEATRRFAQRCVELALIEADAARSEAIRIARQGE